MLLVGLESSSTMLVVVAVGCDESGGDRQLRIWPPEHVIGTLTLTHLVGAQNRPHTSSFCVADKVF